MKSLFTKALLLMLSLCLMSFMTVAQGTIKGKIVDSQTKEPLVGATVRLPPSLKTNDTINPLRR